MGKRLTVITCAIGFLTIAAFGFVGGLTLSAPVAEAALHCNCLAGNPCDCFLGCDVAMLGCVYDAHPAQHAECGLKPGCNPCK